MIVLDAVGIEVCSRLWIPCCKDGRAIIIIQMLSSTLSMGNEKTNVINLVLPMATETIPHGDHLHYLFLLNLISSHVLLRLIIS